MESQARLELESRQFEVLQEQPGMTERVTYIHTNETPEIERKTRRGYFAVKRILDIVLAAAALVVLSPVMLIVAVAVKLDSEGPVIFKQTRVGRDGREFTFYKFRSMKVNADAEKESLWDKNEKGSIVFKIKDDPRITRVGKIIRRTSIDELPQLINILKSDMTIVGPRPPLPDEVKKYNVYQMARLTVKGGLTCYWQISGRSRLSFEEWVELDRKYIEEMGIWTDMKIIFRTVKAVVKGDGAE